MREIKVLDVREIKVLGVREIKVLDRVLHLHLYRRTCQLRVNKITGKYFSFFKLLLFIHCLYHIFVNNLLIWNKQLICFCVILLITVQPSS